MKNIQTTLGWAELPCNTDEGLFLQPEEVTAIDTALASVNAAEQTAADLTTANETIAAHVATINTLTQQKATAEGKVTSLEAEVAKLGKESSGKGSTVITPAVNEVKQEETSSNGRPKFDSPEHPANKFADSQKKYDSGIPVKK